MRFAEKCEILRVGNEISRKWQLVGALGGNHEIQIDGRDRYRRTHLGVVLPFRLSCVARRRHAAARQAGEGKLAAAQGSQSAARHASAGSPSGGGRSGSYAREFQGQPGLSRRRGGIPRTKTLPL